MAFVRIKLNVAYKICYKKGLIKKFKFAAVFEKMAVKFNQMVFTCVLIQIQIFAFIQLKQITGHGFREKVLLKILRKTL